MKASLFLKKFKAWIQCIKTFSYQIKYERPIVFMAILMSTVIISYAQPVLINGNLSVTGNKIVNKNGIPVSFAGNSLFWSNDGWGGEKYYNANVVSWLKNDWNSAIVRAAMGVEDPGGYLASKTSNKNKVKTVVDAAIANNMYVIIDWHSHNAHLYTNEAITFFTEMAQTYGSNPHVIYEIYNEPLQVSWSNTIKPYAETVINAIRAVDPDNLIIVGTPFWSANVDDAANDPINKSNIAYTVHFYSGSHGQANRDKCQYALNKGIALFATEWGSVNANGDGAVNEGETNAWIDFLKRNNISHCNWAINDKVEGSSALTSGASAQGNWTSNNLTWSGSLVKGILKSYDYGKVSEGITYMNSPNLTTPKSSYTVEVNYSVTQKRDLIVSLCDSLNNVIASTTSQVEGVKSVDVVVNLSNLPLQGGKYSWKAELRPTGGNAASNLATQTNATVILLEQDPLVVVEAESYNAMSGIKQETCNEGLSNVGFLDTGDWLSYNPITIPTAGKYLVFFRVASENNLGVISLEKDAGLTKLGTFNVPNTGGWQKWTTISKLIDLPAGSYSLGLGISTGGFNINWLAIAKEPCKKSASITTPKTSICEGQNVTLSTSAVDAVSYVWKNGNTVVSGAGSSSLSVNTSGAYTVEITFADGCKATANPSTITVQPLPNATITTPTNTICKGNSLTLSANTGVGLTYQWSLASVNILNANSSNITINKGGVFTVEVTEVKNGCKAISQNKTITILTTTKPTISAVSNSFCEGSSLELTATDASSYNWIRNNAQIATTKSFGANAAGLYKVETTDNNGCKDTSAAYEVIQTSKTSWYADVDNDGLGDEQNVLKACVKPLGYVSKIGDLCPNDPLKVSPGNCGCGKTENSCLDCAGVPNGTAVIDVCNICAGGTTGLKPTTDIKQCGVNASEELPKAQVMVAPNPFDEQFVVTIPVNNSVVYIYDAQGSLVDERVINQSLSLGSNLNSGIYLVRFKMDGKWYQSKIVKN